MIINAIVEKWIIDIWIIFMNNIHSMQCEKTVDNEISFNKIVKDTFRIVNRLVEHMEFCFFACYFDINCSLSIFIWKECTMSSLFLFCFCFSIDKFVSICDLVLSLFNFVVVVLSPMFFFCFVFVVELFFLSFFLLFIFSIHFICIFSHVHIQSKHIKKRLPVRCVDHCTCTLFLVAFSILFIFSLQKDYFSSFICVPHLSLKCYCFYWGFALCGYSVTCFSLNQLITHQRKNKKRKISLNRQQAF